MVKLYTTPTCVYCFALKQFLKEHKVVFEEIDVSKDQIAAKDMIEKSGQMGVPVVEIDGKIVAGFDKEKISELLKIE